MSDFYSIRSRSTGPVSDSIDLPINKLNTLRSALVGSGFVSIYSALREVHSQKIGLSGTRAFEVLSAFARIGFVRGQVEQLGTTLFIRNTGRGPRIIAEDLLWALSSDSTLLPVDFSRLDRPVVVSVDGGRLCCAYKDNNRVERVYQSGSLSLAAVRARFGATNGLLLEI
nr:p18 [Allamanda chlorotic virus B]